MAYNHCIMSQPPNQAIGTTEDSTLHKGVEDSKTSWRCAFCNTKNGQDEKHCQGCERAKKVKS